MFYSKFIYLIYMYMKTTTKIIGTLAWVAAMSSTANAHDVANGHQHDRGTIYKHQVAQKCATIVDPAPTIVSEPQVVIYSAPVTPMVPTTTYKTITENVCTPVTRQVPTTTYAPAPTHSSGSTTGYYQSTPTYTHTSPTLGDDQCQIEGTNQTVPCPDTGNYTTGTSYTPHTSGTYTGQTYPSGSITSGTTYSSGSITEGYSYPQINTNNVLAWGNPLITGGSSLLDYTRSNSVTNGVNSILNYRDSSMNELSSAARKSIIGNQTWNSWLSINQIRVGGKRPNGVRTTTRGSIESWNFSSRTTYRGR